MDDRETISGEESSVEMKTHFSSIGKSKNATPSLITACVRSSGMPTFFRYRNPTSRRACRSSSRNLGLVLGSFARERSSSGIAEKDILGVELVLHSKTPGWMCVSWVESIAGWIERLRETYLTAKTRRYDFQTEELEEWREVLRILSRGCSTMAPSSGKPHATPL